MNSVASAPKSGAFPVKKNQESSVQHQDCDGGRAEGGEQRHQHWDR